MSYSRAAIFAALSVLCCSSLAMAQEPPAPATMEAENFNTGYSSSAAVSYQVQRQYLDTIRRVHGQSVRDLWQKRFDEKPLAAWWEDAVARFGLRGGDVADALAADWMLSWSVANGALDTDIDTQAVRQQLRRALSKDRKFVALTNRGRQVMAERLMLDFVVQHVAIEAALEEKNAAALRVLGQAAALRFSKERGVDLLALEPGPDGFVPVKRSN